ncbi:MAG TPA: ACP S-malonyltransferase [Bacteroidetes bacterium]|nr:ACP S-malonyltransferase [Bacteroidota bacterium]
MARRLIFIFPGQASQYVGMGRDLYDNSKAARALMDGITRSDGLKQIGDLCFRGPEELLTRTDNVQPAITAVSLMALEAVNEAAAGLDPVKPVACAGHSLGEYSAHAAAGNLTVELTMELVSCRGRWMNEAAQPPNPAGAMVAVMGASLDALKTVVEMIGARKVGIANLNSPGQIILSGEREAVERAAELAGEAGARRCVMLNVSGAWHSPLMRSAQERMADLLAEKLTPEKVRFIGEPIVIANATADIVHNLAEMRDTLTDQITSPVKWEACVRRLVEAAGYPGLPSELSGDGDRNMTEGPLFVEMGPGRVLKGILRGIDRKLDVVNVEDMNGVEELLSCATG